MNNRTVVSKSLGIRIPCDGPLDVQVAECKLRGMNATDVEIEFEKKPRPRALHSTAGHRRNTKLRYK